jgi:hypothetical protein
VLCAAAGAEITSPTVTSGINTGLTWPQDAREGARPDHVLSLVIEDSQTDLLTFSLPRFPHTPRPSTDDRWPGQRYGARDRLCQHTRPTQDWDLYGRAGSEVIHCLSCRSSARWTKLECIFKSGLIKEQGRQTATAPRTSRPKGQTVQTPPIYYSLL